MRIYQTDREPHVGDCHLGKGMTGDVNLVLGRTRLHNAMVFR